MKNMLRTEDNAPTPLACQEQNTWNAEMLCSNFAVFIWGRTSTWTLLANLERFLIMNVGVKIQSFIVSKRWLIIPLPHQVRKRYPDTKRWDFTGQPVIIPRSHFCANVFLIGVWSRSLPKRWCISRDLLSEASSCFCFRHAFAYDGARSEGFYVCWNFPTWGILYLQGVDREQNQSWLFGSVPYTWKLAWLIFI